MQDRIRQILQAQMPMRGQGMLGMGNAANKRAAKRSPWIKFLKEVEMKRGIPYNEAMVDPMIRREYHEMYGSGISIGSAPIKGKYYSAVAAALKKRYGQHAKNVYMSDRTSGLPKRKPKAKSKAKSKARSKARSKKSAINCWNEFRDYTHSADHGAYLDFLKQGYCIPKKSGFAVGKPKKFTEAARQRLLASLL